MIKQAKVLLIFSLVTLTTVFVTESAFTQGYYNATRGLGMGGAGSSTVTGFHANFVNPANLAIPQRTKVSIGLLGGVNPDVGGGLVNISLYNEYFTTGTTITPEVNQEIASRWFGSGSEGYRELGINIDVVPFGVAYQRNSWGAALTSRVRFLADVGMSKGVFLASTGLTPSNFREFQRFDLLNEAVAFAEISAGFGMRVWENASGTEPGTIRVYAGVAPKYLIPMHYHALNLESRLRIQDNPYLITHEFSYEVLTVGRFSEDLVRFQQERQQTGQAPDLDGYFDNSFNDFGDIRGSGFGLDMGVTAEYYLGEFPFQFWATRGNHKIRASFAITDIGSMNMTQSASRVFNSGVFRWDGLDIDQNRLNDEFDSDLEAYFNNVIADSVGNETYLNLRSESLSGHTVNLPGVFNFGVAYDVGKFTFATDIGSGFNTRGTNSTNAYFALGTEFRPVNFIPIRVGMRTGGSSSTAYTFGTGLNLKNFELTFAALTVPNSEANGTAFTAAFSGLVIRF